MSDDYIRGKIYKINTCGETFELRVTAVDDKFISGVDKNGVEIGIRRNLIKSKNL